jgi:hypothetical protein
LSFPFAILRLAPAATRILGALLLGLAARIARIFPNPRRYESARQYEARYESGSQLTAECREQIILGVIEQATPRWWKWPFNWFNICPLNHVSEVFHIDFTHRNDAYRLLETYHCVHQFQIPREIRKAIPALIREALSSKINVTCEIEEAVRHVNRDDDSFLRRHGAPPHGPRTKRGLAVARYR